MGLATGHTSEGMTGEHSQLTARADASVATAVKALVPDDLHRPGFHFTAPANWMNDPNGFIAFQGRYHLFYQHNPYGAQWGNMHWGHAVSKDLVHWEHLPIALAPVPGSKDHAGVYSGCIVVHDEVPTAVYTGVRPECQCLATSRDGMLTWEKYPGNPVIADAPPEFNAGFRDPWVWREGDEWLMAVGSGRNGVGGAVLLYRSKNLRDWEYLHPLLQGDRRASGRMWECPFFFPLGDKHVLVLSPTALMKTIYFVGTYRDRHFVPESQGTLDYGTSDFYAVHFLRDSKGRWIYVAWLREARSAAAQVAAGWSGAMSLPRVVSLRDDGCIAQEPVAELRALRREHFHADDILLNQETPELESTVYGTQLEIRLLLDLAHAERGGLKVLRSPDGTECTTIAYDPWLGQLIIDRSRSSLDRTVASSPMVCPLALKPDELLDLHVFIDHSIIEVFANGGVSMTARVYPTRAESVRVSAWGISTVTRVVAFDAWKLNYENGI